MVGVHAFGRDLQRQVLGPAILLGVADAADTEAALGVVAEVSPSDCVLPVICPTSELVLTDLIQALSCSMVQHRKQALHSLCH